MSKSSEAVKNWRKNTKQRMVDSMGGKCAICNYNRCVEALEFHHIDPTEKELNLGGVRGNPKAWETIIIELRKCILLCSNCHREVHAGIVLIPENYPKFDESFIDYKKKHEELMDNCPICGHTKHAYRKYCSVSCSGKRDKSKFNLTETELLKLKETMSNVEIGNIFNVSEAAIRKRLKKMAPRVGIEPTTKRLTISDSAAELPWNT